MPSFNAKELFKKTSENQISIPSFDVSGGNIDILDGIFNELEKKGATAFISSTPHSIDSYYGIEYFVNVIEQVSNNYHVNFAIHLDHATEPDYIFRAIESGFTSVMYDGSTLPINENIHITKDIVSVANNRGVSVEAELGIISGKEDNITSNDSLLPSLSDCIKFVDKTGIQIFAPAVGTSHGLYKKQPDISWSLVEKLNSNISIPMALHGVSGLNKKIIKKLINNGFKKINYATGIRRAFCNGIRSTISNTNDVIKPQIFLEEGRLTVNQFINEVLSMIIHH